jgi:site-specific DNA recombinase
MSKAKPTDKRGIRCAIYTRKSTEEGLQQEFNSLDAQRESGEAYIAAQKHEGWTCLPDRYDDGGFSGGNMERPALQRLMKDIQAGRVDCVVVFKVDRLSRSLLDFSRIMETFDQHKVSFVSVTQQFNTTHCMGRLTLNILLSFAQFEREIISERTRDKIAAARRKGKFAGGKPVLGYDLLSSRAGPRLVVNEEEAERVRAIFGLYLQQEALIPTVTELAKRGWETKVWKTKRGRHIGGKPFTTGKGCPHAAEPYAADQVQSNNMSVSPGLDGLPGGEPAYGSATTLVSLICEDDGELGDRGDQVEAWRHDVSVEVAMSGLAAVVDRCMPPGEGTT